MDESQASDYKATLAELTSNNKNTINLLTILADDYSESALQIVKIIEDHIYAVPREQKLAVMYLADSIVKNVTGHYRDLFARVIVKMFVHVFKSCDEKVRLALYKLRQTWNDHFPKGKLYELDLKVHEEDAAWPVQPPSTTVTLPISTPTTSGQVHINPRFIEQQRATTTVANTSRVDPRVGRPARTVIAESNEIRVQVPVKKEVSPSTSRAVKVEPDETPAEPLPHTEETKKEMKKEVVERPESSRKRESEDRKERDKRKSVEDSKERSPPPKHARRSPIRQDRRRPHTWGGPSGGKGGVTPSPALPVPTNVAGSHAFAMPPRISTAQPSPPARDSLPRPLMATAPHLLTTSTGESSASPRSDGGVAVPPSAVVIPPPTCHVPPLLPFSSSSITPPSIPGLMTFPSSNPFGPNRPPPMVPTPPMAIPRPIPPIVSDRKHVIKDDNRLEGIPANNRIFVDGKAYEVLYIGETAVIERDGLPHRIYFTGAPRNVVIDGRPYMLGFGEKREVVIDGDVHTIRFGAPSRELYMGDFPFKGAFGGPPIFATINGVRHEIRLSGPAPEVKIEPEPSYELHRFLQQARSGVVRPPVSATTRSLDSKSTTDIKGLLAKLKESGILSGLKDNKETKSKAKPQEMSPPPIPSEIRGTGERAPNPHPLFEKDPFDMRFLKTRYDSIVSSLMAPRSVCPHCGLRFDSMEKNGMEKHLDWHVKRNLSSVGGRETRARKWYGSVQEWTEAKDTVDDEETGEGVAVHRDTTSLIAKSEEADLKASVASSEAVSKVCAVCGDELEEYFDEEDDEWRLKNCVQLEGRVCHDTCAADASMVDEEEPSLVGVKIKEELMNDPPIHL